MSFCFPPQWVQFRDVPEIAWRMREMETLTANLQPPPPKGEERPRPKGQQTQADAILSPEIQEEMFRHAIKDAMPEAAKRRLEPRVVPAEWKSPVLHHSDMTSAGGICSAPKQCIRDLLRQIGYTQAPTAMLCTQHPQELGLHGYPVQELTCTFQVREDDGTEKSIFVDDILFNSALANLSQKMSLVIWLTFLPTCTRLSSSFPLYLDGDLKHAMPEQPENECARPGHQFEWDKWMKVDSCVNVNTCDPNFVTKWNRPPRPHQPSFFRWEFEEIYVLHVLVWRLRSQAFPTTRNKPMCASQKGWACLSRAPVWMGQMNEGGFMRECEHLWSKLCDQVKPSTTPPPTIFLPVGVWGDLCCACLVWRLRSQAFPTTRNKPMCASQKGWARLSRAPVWMGQMNEGGFMRECEHLWSKLCDQVKPSTTPPPTIFLPVRSMFCMFWCGACEVRLFPLQETNRYVPARKDERACPGRQFEWDKWVYFIIYVYLEMWSQWLFFLTEWKHNQHQPSLRAATFLRLEHLSSGWESLDTPNFCWGKTRSVKFQWLILLDWPCCFTQTYMDWLIPWIFQPIHGSKTSGNRCQTRPWLSRAFPELPWRSCLDEVGEFQRNGSVWKYTG